MTRETQNPPRSDDIVRIKDHIRQVLNRARERLETNNTPALCATLRPRPAKKPES